MNRLFVGLRLALFTLFCASAVFAQRDLSTLVGTVTDPSGGVIANAKVIVTETGTGLVYNLTTNGSGEFSRPALKPSTYSITVSAPGFRTAEQKEILLKSGDRTGVNITLNIGDVGQTVEVSASAPLLQTESTHVGAAINEKILTDVPLGGQRNFAYLARLSPGVLPAEPGARDSANGGFSAGGVRSNGQNNFLLNGVDNNVNTIDFLNQTSYAVGPSVEAIGEMSIMTNGFNAEYGRAAGAVINVNLKSGSNQLHGSVFEILQNKDLNANSWTNNTVGKPRGPFVQNQFGATAGGPLKKNKLFMFGDYQGTRIASSGGIQGLGFLNSNATIPTAAMKTGDFSSILGATATGQDSNGNAIQFIKGQIYDPASGVGPNPISRTPFVGNIIPTSRFDPAFAKLIQQFPNTNQAIIRGSQPTGDYFYNTPGSQVTDQGDGRVDYRLTDKDSLFGSISWGNTGKTLVAPFPGALDNSGFTGVAEKDLNRNAQISYTRVWTPTMVSETRASFTRLVTSRVGANPDADLFAAFGIGGYNPTKNYTGNGGLPLFSASGYTGFGGAQWSPTLEYNNVWDFVQNFAISKNSHSIKMGAEFRQVKFPFFQVPSPHGLVAYNSNQTAFPSTKASSLGPQVGASTGDAIASALLGQIDNGQVSTTNFISSQKVAWAGYFQDDWKVNRKLTVNIGVRYELLSPIGERFARQANFDLQTMTLYIPKGKQQDLPLPPNFAASYPNVKVDRGSVSNYMIPWDKLDFGPRIGMAYQVNAKTVLRGGYGIFYGGEENQGGSPNRGEGVPFNETVNLVRTPGAVSSFVGINDPACAAAGCQFMPGGLTGGFPSNPFALNAAISFRGVQTDYRNALVHKWNMIVQRELPHDMALEIGYEGNHQAHQLLLPNTDTYTNLGTTNSAITADSLRYINAACPTCASVGTGLSMTVSNGFGNYAAGSAKLEKRFTHGLQFLTAYTWSHALANANTSLSGSANLGYPDPSNFASGYSSASWDIRHSLTSSFNYDLPFGKGRTYGNNMNRALDTIAGGWHANGILSARTGIAYGLTGSCQGVWGRCEPDVIAGVVPNQAPAGGRTPSQWFDTSSFKVAAPLTGGNLGLQAMTGPPTRTLDFSMFKDVSFTERFKLQFRAEATNFTNSNQFSIPTSQNVVDSKALGGNGNFGKIVSTVAGTERRVQFQLRLSF